MDLAMPAPNETDRLHALTRDRGDQETITALWRAGFGLPREGCARFERQLIGRDMPGAERDGGRQPGKAAASNLGATRFSG